MRKIFASSVVALLIFTTMNAMAHERENVIQQARKLIEANRDSEAYAMLEHHMSEMAGDKEYDYLLGIAARKTRKPGEAIFALTRAVYSDPKFGGAHFELAQAYYEVYAYAESQSEFQASLALNPPQAIHNSINEYLRVIDEKMSPRARYQLGVELATGADSNANSATSSESFGVWQLSAESRATSSPVKQTNVDLHAQLPLTRHYSTSIDAVASDKEYSRAHFVDTQFATFTLGMHYQSPTQQSALRLRTQRLWVAEKANNENNQLELSLKLIPNPTNHVMLTATSGTLRFPRDFAYRDVDQTQLALNWDHSIPGAQAASSTFIASLGHDAAVQSNSPYGREYAGMQAGLQLGTNLRTTLYTYTGVTQSVYQGRWELSGLGDRSRSDRATFLAVGALIRPIKSWAVKPQFVFIRQSSNHDLYDYDRLNAVITLRYSVGQS